MGEVVVSSGGGEEGEVLQEVKTEADKKRDGSVVRWERFLPRMALRVLLVEADDSTRQIIAALLRKCSYRVAAVPDGLKAWEVLKGRPHNIDLILTEVELPSISGFALLTLIMEHEICKNIPVIMMSSHDSISTVYKCMMRGAADFLVKPVRRNELRNLWQHVWRRQSSTSGGNGLQDESVAQLRVEATSENNAASNHSSGYKACVHRHKECIEKGSDAQSSCTKPDMEAESACMENMQDLSQQNWSRSLVGDMKLQKRKADVLEAETGGSLATFKDVNMVEQETQKEDPNNTSEACDNNYVLLNSSKEVIDLIGTFDSCPKYSYQNSGSDNVKKKFDSSPQLYLSLRRPHSCGAENQTTEEKHTLNHSNASAFSRYINRTLNPVCPASAGVCNQQKEYGIETDKNLPADVPGYNIDSPGPIKSMQRSIIAMAAGESGQAEISLPCPQQRVFSAPVPERGMRFDSIRAGYGSVPPPIFCTQPGPSPMQSPRSASQPEDALWANRFQSSLDASNSRLLFETLDQNASSPTNQTSQKQEQKLDSNDQMHFSPATDQSASSSFCNGAVTHLNGIGCGSICGSNGNVNPVAVISAVAESGNEESLFMYDGKSHRSIQREAALTKFRLKRKDRCYEKKVRYESRKKLAEQRPRVKGQFVRQVPTDPSLGGTDNCGGTLFDG